jgi:hypothetical protein
MAAVLSPMDSLHWRACPGPTSVLVVRGRCIPRPAAGRQRVRRAAETVLDMHVYAWYVVVAVLARWLAGETDETCTELLDGWMPPWVELASECMHAGTYYVSGWPAGGGLSVQLASSGWTLRDVAILQWR